MKIAVVGLWHLGTITSLSLSKLNNLVYAFDSKKIIDEFNLNNPPIQENGVLELLKKYKNKNIFFNQNFDDLNKFNLIWVTYDSKIDNKDKSDFKYIFSKIKNILKHVKKNTTIIISSQLQIGSTIKIENFEKKFIKKNTSFVYIPENLRLGSSINLFLNPDRIVIGLRNDKNFKKNKSIINKLFHNLNCKKIIVNPETAEMSKHVINGFLACSISFINEISQISRNYGIPFDDLVNCIKSDKRIGKYAYLRPGNAFSGGTLARDLNFLIKVGKKFETNHQLIKSVNKSNAVHSRFLENILYKNINSKKTKILQIGLSYKKNTSTVRRSIPYKLFNSLKKKYYIKVYDKYLINHKKEVLHLSKYFLSRLSKEKFDLILIFSKIDNFKKIKGNFKNNAKIIDFEGSNKKSILSKNLSYISLENE